jgi:hypothetical protein
MPTLTLWCIDKANVVTKLVDTADEIYNLIVPCLQHQKYFDDVDVFFPQYKPNPLNTDLVVYYLANQDSVGHVLDARAASTVAEDDGQTTWSTGGNGSTLQFCSEVRVGASAKSSALGLAKLTFHELMHNKLQVGDALHSRGGLAGASVDENTPMTTKNAKDFGQALVKQHTQWMGGYDNL